MTHSPLIIWRICDGNTGHEKQSQALVEGLQTLLDIQVFDIPASLTNCVRWLWPLSRSKTRESSLPKPDLLISIGHSTHVPMLVARWVFGGRCVVISSPSLPLACFDLAVIPAHDNPPERHNVIRSRVALAPTMQCQPDMARGLFLIGGESRHFEWDSAAVSEAVSAIARHTPSIQWQLTTSRRTPAAMQLPEAPNLTAYHYQELAADWLAQELGRAGYVCLTMDSASMLAESLNTGAHVMLLPLKSKVQPNKLQRGAELLLQEQRVDVYSPEILPGWPANATKADSLNEHLRIAALIKQRWFADVEANSKG